MSASEDEYKKRLNGYFNAGCAGVAIALAKDVGILKVLFESETPLSSQEISDRGELKERYCRELLGALVTSQVVEVDAASEKYFVPKEHRRVLQGSAIYQRLIPYVGTKFEAVSSCFKQAGPAGVRYDEYPIAFNIMFEAREFSQDSLLDDFVLKVPPGLHERLERGIEAAEIGCGYGTLSNNLAKRYPATTFTSSDVVAKLTDYARKIAEGRGLTNITYEIQDLYKLPASYENRFDWILIRDVIHDLPYPEKAMKALFFALKPGGVLSLLEVGTTGSLHDNVGNMSACCLYTLSSFNCLPESFQEPDSAALGAAWNVLTAKAMIEAAGFTLVKEHHSINNYEDIHYVCQKPI